MPEIETREFEVRFEANDTGAFTALAVPYNQEANIGGQYLERFAPGSIDSVVDVPIFYGHDYTRLPIGKAVMSEERAEGHAFTAEFTPGIQMAQEVRAALAHGTLTKVSVGFNALESERDGQTITRTKAQIREISIVPFPAYLGAEIQEVREETTEPQPEQESDEMSENIEMDVRSVQDEVAELRREIENMATVPATAPSFAIRSMGELAKGLLKQDTQAVELARAASTSADAALQTPFIGYVNTLINNSRPTVSSFSRGSLPATGLAVEYAKIDSNTLAVGVQSPENEALSFGNLTFETVSASVVTYGGYTSFSRQYVERSSINTLDQVFAGLTIAYANATNAALVSALAALDYTGKTFDADGGTAASLIEGVANGASYIFQNTGLSPEFILAAPDAYVKMMTVAGLDGRPVMNVDGAGVNNIGSANIPGLRGNLLGLPVIVDPALATGVVYLANSAAVQTLESGTVRLNDGDVTTLTDSTSVYGYMAITTPRVGAIVKLDVTA